MKICFVGLENLPVLAREYNHYGIGGAQLQMTLLAKALVKRGYHISMVVGDYGQPDGACWEEVQTFKAYRHSAGIPVLRFFHPRWSGMWSALKRANADIYFTSCAGMLVGQMAMFCSQYKRGLVFRLAHDWDADPANVLIRLWRDKKLYEYGLRNADCVLCQNTKQQQGLSRHYGINGTLIKSLVERPQRESALPERDIDVLWVNNIRDIKRPDLVLDLAQRFPSCLIHMAGGTVTGFIELYEFMVKEVAKLPNLTFHGRVPYHNVGELYDRTKIFVNTSDSEGFPNSYLQSWRRGVPVVAFFDPDGIIQREGLGAAVHSMDAMQSAVHELLTDGDLWHACSERCRKYMERVHGDDAVLKPYLDAFETANRKRKLR